MANDCLDKSQNAIGRAESGEACSGQSSAAILVWVLLIVHVGLLGYGAYVHSPTLNEPGHLVAGISYWKLGRFSVYHVNPPLVRLVAASPVIAVGVRTDWSRFSDAPGNRCEYPLSEDFVAANGERVFWLVTIARWACIPFSVLGGYVCFLWGRELYGCGAGLLALLLWCFCPNIIANGQLITSDAAATSLGVAACYTFWRWLKRPLWTGATVCGGMLGLAQLCKTTFIIFYLIWPVMALAFLQVDRRTIRRKNQLGEITMMVYIIIVSIYVINLGYAFEGTGRRLGDFPFVSPSLRGEADVERRTPPVGNRFAGSWLGVVPVPLPENYVLGIDTQRRDFESCGMPSYLRGRFSPSGWWYYYLYALAVKIPLGTWILLGIATVSAIPRGVRSARRNDLILLSPAVGILAFVSSQTGFSEHTRYVLPISPFLFIWAGGVARVCRRIRESMTLIVGALVMWAVGSSLMVYPHSLSYFNELTGGPLGGPAHLIGSSIDWGQDLLELRAWLRAHPEVSRLNLAYYGSVDPRYAGIDYQWPSANVPDEQRAGSFVPSPGWYAVSVNLVRGYPRSVYNGYDGHLWLAERELIRFQNVEPVAIVGYSIFIYHILDSDE